MQKVTPPHTLTQSPGLRSRGPGRGMLGKPPPPPPPPLRSKESVGLPPPREPAGAPSPSGREARHRKHSMRYEKFISLHEGQSCGGGMRCAMLNDRVVTLKRSNDRSRGSVRAGQGSGK